MNVTSSIDYLEAQFQGFQPPADVPGMTIQHLREGIQFFLDHGGTPVIWKRQECFVLVAAEWNVRPVRALLEPVPGQRDAYYLPVNV